MGLDLYVCSNCNDAITGYENHHVEFSNCDTDLDLCDECYDSLIKEKFIKKVKNEDENDGYQYKLLHKFCICLISRTSLKFNTQG